RMKPCSQTRKVSASPFSLPGSSVKVTPIASRTPTVVRKSSKYSPRITRILRERSRVTGTSQHRETGLSPIDLENGVRGMINYLISPPPCKVPALAQSVRKCPTGGANLQWGIHFQYGNPVRRRARGACRRAAPAAGGARDRGAV